MSKEKSPAFQCYAAEYLADINTQLMTIEEEGCYWRLMLFCWREGFLPNEPETLSQLCKGTYPTNRVLSCFVLNGDKYFHKRLEAERAKQEEWRKKCAKGGRNSAHKPKHRKKIDGKQSSCRGEGNLLLSKRQVNRKSENRGKNKLLQTPQSKEIDYQQGSGTLQSSTSSSIASSNIGNIKKPSDSKNEAYDLWAKEFLEHRSVPYQDKQGDFIQLARLKKLYKLNGSGIPPKFLEAMHNYFASPLTVYTLADLCVKYDIFINGKVDRFNKPEMKPDYSSIHFGDEDEEEF